MASSLDDSPECLRQAIDDELESLEKTARALKLRRNALAPISRLPPETIAIIFSFLSLPREYARHFPGDKQDHLSWLRVSHVCHRWREIALDQPRFWSHVDFATLTSAAATEVLSRSKMAPLELEANLSCAHWGSERLDAFREQLATHVSHTCRLSITADGHDLQSIIDRLASPAPALEFLSLVVEDETYLHLGISPDVNIPFALFDCTAPRLSRLQLDHCNINWMSPLFKGLRILELQTLATRPSLGEWLDAMDQMLQLDTLVVNDATPKAPPIGTRVSEPTRVITHPSLTQLNLAASASDCTLALSHLLLPALIRLRVDVASELPGGDDVLALIPYFSRNAHGPRDGEPIRSILVSGEPSLTEVVMWKAQGADIEVQNPVSLIGATLSARAIFTASGHAWRIGTDVEIFDATLAALPLGSLNTLTVQNSSKFPERIWLAHASRWPLLERVRLVGTVAKSFITVLGKDPPSEDPLLPSLTNLSLLNTLHTDDMSHLLDMLTLRVEQGVPLEALDLRACEATDRAVQLFGEIVVDVQGPDAGFRSTGWWPTLSNWSRDMGLLLFHRDADENEDGEDEGLLSDNNSLMLNPPWFHGYINSDDEDEENEDEEVVWW